MRRTGPSAITCRWGWVAREGIARSRLCDFKRGKIRRHEVDADHLTVGIDGGRGVCVESDFSVDQVGVVCARLPDHGNIDGAVEHFKLQSYAVVILKHSVDCAFDLNPLGVFRAGVEVRKAYARRVRGQRGTADDTNLWFDHDGTEASFAADTFHIDRRTGEQRSG